MNRCACGAPIVNGHHCENGHLQTRDIGAALRALSASVAAIALTGCAGVGVNVFADFSESISGSYVYRIEGSAAPGPQARAGVEVDKRFANGFAVAAGLEHRSFPVTTHDRGEERAYIGARYRWEPSK